MTPEAGATARTGSSLLDVVTVMDRLLSPSGCPWDREQTHRSLTRYLVEETYEVLDAVDDLTSAGADPGRREQAEADLAEELGDVLLQVVFHARLAQQRGTFDIDVVAAGLRDKLVRRHPHVFADEQHATGDAVQQRWDELKAAEKPARGPLDGVPRHLPSLARADKVLSRLERAGLEPTTAAVGPDEADASGLPDPAGSVGRELFELVRRARAVGVDAEQALREHVRAVESAVADGAGNIH